jgi:hypothetical protein
MSKRVRPDLIPTVHTKSDGWCPSALNRNSATVVLTLSVAAPWPECGQLALCRPNQSETYTEKKGGRRRTWMGNTYRELSGEGSQLQRRADPQCCQAMVENFWLPRCRPRLRACSVSSQSMWIEWDWMGLNPKQVKLLIIFSNSIQSMCIGNNRTRPNVATSHPGMPKWITMATPDDRAGTNSMVLGGVLTNQPAAPLSDRELSERFY